jgi:hypothetical protein
MSLKVIELIRNHPDWQTILSKEPYSLKVRTNPKYPHLYIIVYNQIESDFNDQIVKECRGLIIHIDDQVVRPVCVPFYKFGNWGESYADSIVWSTARIQEKIDGSLMKLWYYQETKEWILSSNGTIDAFTANLTFPCGSLTTFGQAFMQAHPSFQGKTLNQIAEFYHMDPQKTYMFELTGPYNRIVVHYPLDVYHIGVRNNLTLQEEPCTLPFKTPKEYHFNSLMETIEFSKTLTIQEEGYVVVDGDWHRVKVKGEAYVRLHQMHESLTPKRFIAIILKHEEGEVLTCFPQYHEIIDTMKRQLVEFIETMSEQVRQVTALKEDIKQGKQTRKEYATIVKRMVCTPIMFDYLQDKFTLETFRTYMSEMSPEKVLNWMGWKNSEEVVVT